jgi:O-antigen/teichoic acid export membrane protein
MALSLRRNAAWALAGQLVFAACHWGGLIILGRLAGPEELGRYALALAVVTPIMLFGGLQMRELQVADAKQRHAFEDYFAVRLAGTVLAGTIVLAVALLGYSWQVGLPILLVGLSRAFESLSHAHYGMAHRHKRLDLVAQSMMLRGVLGLLALGLGYYLTRDLGIGLTGIAVAWGLVWWLFDRPMTKRWRDPFDSRRAWRSSLRRRLDLAWTALPLGMALMLVTLNPNVPRYFIEAMFGLGALGLFTAMAQFVIAGRMLITAACQAAFPRLADLYATGEVAAFRLLLLRLVGVSILPGLLGLMIAVAFGRELLGLVYGPQFAGAADVFPWIMLVGVVLYAQTPFGYGLTAMHQFRVQPVIFGSGVAVNVAGCVALIPPYGLLGATGSWLAAVACLFLLSLYVHWRCLRRPAEGKAVTPTAPDLPGVQGRRGS